MAVKKKKEASRKEIFFNDSVIERIEKNIADETNNTFQDIMRDLATAISYCKNPQEYYKKLHEISKEDIK